jgi:hypothetical protein
MAVQLSKQPWPSEYRPDVTNFYGDPDPGEQGVLSASWQKNYIVHVPPPYPMVWDLDPPDGGKPVAYLTMNKKCVDSAMRCFQAILEAYPNRADLEAAQLHMWGGAFNFRPMRGTPVLSMHGFGCALDLAPTRNPQHAPYEEDKGMMPMKVVQIFEAEGWTWGGRWSARSIDCMHFQAAHL